MRVVWCSALLFVVSVLHCGVCLRFDAKEEFNSIICPTTQTHNGMILDIHRSMDRGAKLIEGTWQSTLERCVSQCCLDDDCDMALYKNEGVSQSGKNCYFVQCGDPKNCVIVEHSGFTSVTLEASDDAAGNDGKGYTDLKSPHSDSPATDSAPERSDMEPSPSTKSNVVSMATTTLASSVASPTTAEGGSRKDSKDETTTPHTEAPPTTTPPPPTHTTASSSNSSNKSPSPNAAGALPNSTIVEINKALLSSNDNGGDNEGGLPAAAAPHSKDCGKYGCDGSGLIAVAVVGSICFAIVVLVVAVFLKRVVDDKRKKRFNNVDYLINGMYT